MKEAVVQPAAMITADGRAFDLYVRGTKALLAGRNDAAFKLAGWAHYFASDGPMAEKAQALLADATTAVMTDLLRGGPVSAAAADDDPAPLTTQLADGTTGWYMRRGDDCLVGGDRDGAPGAA